MLLSLLILSTLAALWWLTQLFASSQRCLKNFIYSTSISPDALNGAFPGDDVTQLFAGDPVGGEWPSVTVIVPGRNEGHLLAKTLGSLCAMDYPNFRVVFIDDQSTDNTAEVCRQLEAMHPHLTVIHNTEAPRNGWIGKTWAVHQADAHMHSSDYLLFTDSDLEFHPGCLRHMIRLARHRRSDITSLLPRIYYESTGELLGLLGAMCLINAGRSLYHTNNPKIAHTLVAGGFILVKRETYHELGGHAAVRGQIVEDIALGIRAKALNKRVFTAFTHDLYRARMYEGTRDTFHGLKKNAYAGANYSPAFAALIAAFLLLICTLTPLYAIVGIIACILHPTALTFATMLAGIAAFAFQTAAAARTARFVAFPALTALLISPSFAFYLAVFLGSIFDYYRGGNTWSGRQVKNAQTLASAGAVDNAQSRTIAKSP